MKDRKIKLYDNSVRGGGGVCIYTFASLKRKERKGIWA